MRVRFGFRHGTDRGRKPADPGKIGSYFRQEVGILAIVAVTGIFYNIGMAAGPWFEGQLAQYLYDIIRGERTGREIAVLSLVYVLVIAMVQLLRFWKRLFVRRFANDVNKSIKGRIYHTAVHLPVMGVAQGNSLNIGDTMTRAVADAEACTEGMRKATTEVFDTGVVMLVYLVMLLSYDWRLALLCLVFPPIAYLIAAKLRKMVTRTAAAAKESAGRLNSATLDMTENALTYRVYGAEKLRRASYEEALSDYEKRSALSDIWNGSLQPVYLVISMAGVLPILYYGSRNVLGTGWQEWNIAAFSTFIALFTKLANKSSKAAKLFNAVQKAEVSWKRIQPLLSQTREETAQGTPGDTMTADSSSAETEEETTQDTPGVTAAGEHASTSDIPAEGRKIAGSLQPPFTLRVEDLSFAYPGSETKILSHVNFTAEGGQIIGVTGEIASGKSTLGRIFLGEYPYEGRVMLRDAAGRVVRGEDLVRTKGCLSYLGHEPELFDLSIVDNIRLGAADPAGGAGEGMGGETQVQEVLRAVRFDEETAAMEAGARTIVGNSARKLSGGQQQRLALARALYHRAALYILDDPFSALDVTTERQILPNLREQEKNSIILLISHRLEIFPELDGVLWMERGSLTQSTHAALMRENGGYACLFREQTAGKGDTV